MRKIILFGFLAITSLHCWSQVESSNWDLIDQRKIPEWFEDAKFGIFIHWGVYSVPSYRAVSDRKYASYAEWYYARVMFDTLSGGADFHNRNYGSNFDYHDFAPMFRAELFDPAAWARMFKDSGAKYVVLTSKHHDGYCLWPASHPLKKNWNSLAVGPKRDLVGDLTKAVRNEGLKMGLYYSSIEWESSPTSRRPNGWWLPDEVHKKYRIPEDQFVPMINQQLREIINLYEPSLLFADGGEWDGTAEYWGTKEFLRWLYEESPVKDEIVVNDRLSKESPGKHGDYYSSEYQDADGVGIDHPWEESRGMGGSYGFNRAENLEDYRSSAELVHELVDIVSRGGNLLLNVGPTADGRIPVFMQERLSDIGHWLDTNGESIFGTRPFESGKANTKEVRFTRTDEAIYAICLKWPGRYLVLDGFPANREASVSLLGSDNEVIVSKSGSRLLIETPDLNPATFLSGYAWVFKISFAK
jgi:alpha-L-fucosidase